MENYELLFIQEYSPWKENQLQNYWALLVCGSELKLLSLYLRLVQPEVKIFVLFYLMFPNEIHISYKDSVLLKTCNSLAI